MKLGILLTIAALAIALPAAAQPATGLALGGFSGAFGVATSNDFEAGERVSATATTFTVSITALNARRATTLFVRSNIAVLGGSKPIADLEWRRNDLGTWNPLTTTDTFVETRTIQTNGTLWSNSIWFRCKLRWVDDPSGAYGATIVFTLQVAAP